MKKSRVIYDAFSAKIWGEKISQKCLAEGIFFDVSEAAADSYDVGYQKWILPGGVDKFYQLLEDVYHEVRDSGVIPPHQMPKSPKALRLQMFIAFSLEALDGSFLRGKLRSLQLWRDVFLKIGFLSQEDVDKMEEIARLRGELGVEDGKKAPKKKVVKAPKAVKDVKDVKPVVALTPMADGKSYEERLADAVVYVKDDVADGIPLAEALEDAAYELRVSQVAIKKAMA